MTKKNAEVVALFPKTIYVNREDPDENGGYLLANEDIESIEETAVIGIYELVRTGRVTVTRSVI